MIELTTLGSVDLRLAGGGEIRAVLAQRKRLALFTYLVMARPRGFHFRDSLLPIFWPEMNDARARHALRQSLHFLRQALGSEAIQTRGSEEIGVARNSVVCDALAFEEWVAQGSWEKAVSLYNGPLLRGFAVSHAPEFDRWLDAERRRLGDLYVKALDGLLESTDLTPDEAVQWLRRRSEHDPYDPGVTLRLMRALEAAHDRPGALHQARAHIELVTGELGVEPDKRVLALADRLALAKPATSSTDTPLHTAGARTISRAKPTVTRRLPIWIGSTVMLVLLVAAGWWLSRERPPEVVDAADNATQTLIVMPFTGLPDSLGQYLADGVADGVVNRLAGIQALRVIGWARVGGTSGPQPTDYGERFPDAEVISATVRRETRGDDSTTFRVVASATRMRDSTVVWHTTFERGYVDLPLIERDLAAAVVEALGIPSQVAERAWLEAVTTANADAYNEYVSGVAALDQRDWIDRKWTTFGPNVDFERAIRHFEAAVELDSTFVFPLARLAIANTSMFFGRYDRTRARLELARDAMNRAVQLRPDAQATHLAAAWYYYLGEGDYNRALRHLRVANSEWAGKVEATLLTGEITSRQGEYQEALDQYRAAERHAGICPECLAEMAFSYYVLGDIPHAAEASKTASVLAPNLTLPRYVSALIHLTEFGDIDGAKASMPPLDATPDGVLRLVSGRWSGLARIIGGEWDEAVDRMALEDVPGDTAGFYLAKADLAERRGQPDHAVAYYDSARIAIERIADVLEDNPYVRSELGLAYAGLGRKTDAIREGAAAVRLRPLSKDVVDGPLFTETLALIYMKLGEFNTAVRLLEDVVEEPGMSSRALLRLDPRWVPLRAHRGFRRLITPTRPT